LIDLHVHALAGIDDGPPTLDSAVSLAVAAAEDGTGTLVATPHVSDRYPNTPESIATAAAALRTRLEAERVGVSVLTGAEIAIERLATLDDAALDALTLGAGPYLLIESPLRSSAGDVEGPLTRLLAAGRRVVLAHPERSPAFHRDPQLLGQLVGSGVLTSVTAAAITGAFGKTVRRFSEGMHDEGLIHNLASDAHDVGTRPPTLTEALAQIAKASGEAWEEWLVEIVPEAVLGGHPIPAAPRRPVPPRHRLRRLLRRG
jgi:protein-tyrosine phosphatase